ncbi:MAG: hypothetical protein ABIR87_05000, partial [Sphingomicrobium sp.]
GKTHEKSGVKKASREPSRSATGAMREWPSKVKVTGVAAPRRMGRDKAAWERKRKFLRGCIHASSATVSNEGAWEKRSPPGLCAFKTGTNS